EDEASRYFERTGYVILARNWRFGRAEIDLIASRDQDVVFVEVKTRQTRFFGEPELRVSKAQQKRLALAATAFMQNLKSGFTPRFDVVAIITGTELLHIEDAFFPDWF